MTITARYTTRCPRCGGLIQEGSAAEWERGQKATHVTCPATPATPAARTTPARETTAGAPSAKQLRYALSLLRRHDEPLLDDAFSKPTAAEVEAMTRAQVSELIDALRSDIYGDY